jgi:hypothetical protein
MTVIELKNRGKRVRRDSEEGLQLLKNHMRYPCSDGNVLYLAWISTNVLDI